MYALIINGVVEKYPYSIGELRKDNPQVSFPKFPSNKLLEEFNVFNVIEVSCPKVEYNQNVAEVAPQNINGVWTQVWEISQASDDDITKRTIEKTNEIRSMRNYLISETDWTQLDDTPVGNAKKLEWASYRQALRDIPSQPGFPWSVSWPEKP